MITSVLLILCLTAVAVTGDNRNVWVVDKNYCVDSPCQNGGRCFNLPDKYFCWCRGLYTNKECQTAVSAYTGQCEYVRFSAWTHVEHHPKLNERINVSLVLQDVGGGYPAFNNGAKFVAPCNATYHIGVYVGSKLSSRFSYSLMKGVDRVLFSVDSKDYNYPREITLVVLAPLVKDEYLWLRADQYHDNFEFIDFFGYVLDF